MPGRLLIFWDYDTQWGADRSRSAGGPKNWGTLEFENTDRLLDLHARYNLPACFAIVGAAALPGSRPYHDPVQVRRIHALGHEIASHTLHHEWIPGLGAGELARNVRQSKDVLEQCIGAEVVSFVPPHNQPFDYWQRGAISLSERRQVKQGRIDLPRLCEILAETGYHFCRVVFASLLESGLERFTGRVRPRLSAPEKIGGLTCLRLRTPAGFTGRATALVEAVSRRGGWAVVYGHPHSLSLGSAQDERYLIPFLETVSGLCQAGALQVVTPRDLLKEALQPNTIQ